MTEYARYFTVSYDLLDQARWAIRKATRIIEARDRFMGSDLSDEALLLRKSQREIEDILASWVPPESSVDLPDDT